MKLDDFLKRKKVRCINRDNHGYLTENKVYDVTGVDRDSVYIVNDNDNEDGYLYKHFEPVLDSAENPRQDMKLTPEFEAVVPHVSEFKVGDPVYKYGETDVKTVLEVFENGYMRISDYPYRVNHETLCHANQENYERLQAIFPDIEFEQPAKELKGSDLARAMLDKGWKFVPCYVHDRSDDEAMNRKHYVLVKKETPKNGYNFSGTGANDWKYAVPIDPRTGEPLTQAVLGE